MSFLENSKRSVQQVFGMNAKAREIGIEIEMEGTGPIGGIDVPGWQVHEEGSLRAPGGEARGGAEYVTRGPIAFEHIQKNVDNLAEALKKNECEIDLSAHRTSTHIHLNVQSLPLIDLLGYVAVFSAVEPLFLHLCGEQRDGNAFCISSYETGDLPEYIHAFCKQIEQGRWDMYDRGKYASLSLFRLRDLGTVECRCFPVSLDGKQISEWAQWLINIRNVVTAETDKSFRQVIKTGLYNPLILAERVFGRLPEYQVSSSYAQELVTFGSQQAYELTRLLKRYLNKKPEEIKLKGKSKYTIDELVAPVEWAPVNLDIPQPAAAPRPFVNTARVRRGV